jgi:hypothetical protein
VAERRPSRRPPDLTPGRRSHPDDPTHPLAAPAAKQRVQHPRAPPAVEPASPPPPRAAALEPRAPAGESTGRRHPWTTATPEKQRGAEGARPTSSPAAASPARRSSTYHRAGSRGPRSPPPLHRRRGLRPVAPLGATRRGEEGEGRGGGDLGLLSPGRLEGATGGERLRWVAFAGEDRGVGGWGFWMERCGVRCVIFIFLFLPFL